MGKNSPDIPEYKEMEDTPWITQARELANIGGEGLKKNYNRVDVFDEPTRQSLQARVNDMYRTAESDYDRTYRNTMQNLANKNYRQFGTLNATPAAYNTDMANLQSQRHLADMAYNRAKSYEDVVNNELQRRYNTLNMYKGLYGLGETPYQQDVRNWETRNYNLDRAYQNQLANSAGGFDFGSLISGGINAGIAGATGGIGNALGGELAKNIFSNFGNS